MNQAHFLFRLTTLFVFAGSSACGGPTGGEGCIWWEGQGSDEVRLHVVNTYDQPQVRVSVESNGTSCIIEDEMRNLWLPVFGNTFPEGPDRHPCLDASSPCTDGTLGALGQAVLPAVAGDTITVSVDGIRTEHCVVTGETDQVFVSVEAGSSPNILCQQGFEGYLVF